MNSLLRWILEAYLCFILEICALNFNQLSLIYSFPLLLAMIMIFVLYYVVSGYSGNIFKVKYAIAGGAGQRVTVLNSSIF